VGVHRIELRDSKGRIETAMSPYIQATGDGLRSHTNMRRKAEVNVAVHVLNRIPGLGRLNSGRIA